MLQYQFLDRRYKSYNSFTMAPTIQLYKFDKFTPPK